MHILRHEGIFFYAPNIEEVERVYWCLSIHPSVIFAHGQELLELKILKFYK